MKDLKVDEDIRLQVVAEDVPAVADTAETRKKSRGQRRRRIRLSDERMGRGDSTDEVESTDEAAQQTSGEEEWEDC